MHACRIPKSNRPRSNWMVIRANPAAPVDVYFLLNLNSRHVFCGRAPGRSIFASVGAGVLLNSVLGAGAVRKRDMNNSGGNSIAAANDTAGSRRHC